MKNLISKSILLVLCFLSMNSFAQENRNSISLMVTANDSDVNYGHEMLFSAIKNEDYSIISSAGDGSFGVGIGLTYTRQISNRIAWKLGVGYTGLNYEIEGSLTGLRDNVTRPTSNSIVTSATGKVNYGFVNINTGLTFSLSDNYQKGLKFNFNVNNLSQLVTNWNLDVTYEDLSSGKDDMLEDALKPTFNNMWFVGAGLQYNFVLLEDKLTVSPLAQFSLGLMPLVDENPSTSMVEVGISMGYWF